MITFTIDPDGGNPVGPLSSRIHQFMWPARVRTPPCCFVARKRGRRVVIGEEGGGVNRAVGNT